MSRDYFSELKNRIQYIIDSAGINQTKLANLLGLEPSFISQIVGGTKPKLGGPAMRLISVLFSIPYDWVATGMGEVPANITLIPSLVPIRVWEWAGIGNAFDINSQSPENEHEPIEIIMLPEELVNAWRDSLKVFGESMNPTLGDGDYVGVDFHDKRFHSGQLYAIYSKYEGYTVKRLEGQSPYGILIKSDNPSHGDYLIEHDKIEHDLQIIGRVAWIFGTRKKHEIKQGK